MNLTGTGVGDIEDRQDSWFVTIFFHLIPPSRCSRRPTLTRLSGIEAEVNNRSIRDALRFGLYTDMRRDKVLTLHQAQIVRSRGHAVSRLPGGAFRGYSLERLCPFANRRNLKAVISPTASLASMQSSMRSNRRADFPARAS